MLESFLLSLAANFATDAVKKIWHPIRRRLIDRGGSQTAIDQFEANDVQGRAAVKKYIDQLLQDEPEYLREIEKANKKLVKILDSANHQNVQKIKAGKKARVIGIMGDSNTSTMNKE